MYEISKMSEMRMSTNVTNFERELEHHEVPWYSMGLYGIFSCMNLMLFIRQVNPSGD